MNSGQTKRAARRRQALLDAARRVVSDGGFKELQMLAVAAAADTAVGTIYRYFPTKADLCAALVDAVSSRELDVISAICASDAGPPAALRDAVATFARRALRNRRLAYAMIAEPVDAPVDDVRLLWRARIGGVLASVIAAGIAEGRFRTVDPALAAACIVGAFMEALVGPLSPADQGTDDDELAGDIAALCVAIVADPAERED